MNMVLNLTQHPASSTQIAIGVVDLAGEYLASLKDALLFDDLPDEQEIRFRAQHIAGLACMNEDDQFPGQAMIGGAFWLMAPLAEALRDIGIEPLFAFSVRETEEQKQPDGSVRKVSVFRHAGFIPAVE